MTTPLDPQRAQEFQALDDLGRGDITEAELKEYIGDDWAEIVEGAHAEPIGATFADGFIDQFLSRRVCARCYGHLEKRPVEGREWEAFCPVCEGKWAGATVSKSTADIRASDALLEYMEVTTNPDLADLFPRARKTPEQIIDELY